MGLPHSTFYNFAKMNAFFVIGNNIYPIRRKDVKNKGGIIEVQSAPISLEVLEKVFISDLERSEQFKTNVQAQKNGSEHRGLAKFVIEDVLGKKMDCEEKRKGSIIDKIIPPEGILIKYGSCYRICNDQKGTVKVNGTRYAALENSFAIENLENDYLRKMEKYIFSLEDIALKSQHYDTEKRLGFIIDGDDFYVYTEISPYFLYERDDGKYYRFGRAKVGSRLILKDGKIEWNRLVVIDNYSHPSLPEHDKPFQVICVGDFDYDSIERKYPTNVVLQVIELMRKGKKVLTAEYTSYGRPWHRLTDNTFNENIVKGGEKITALNY